MSPDAIPPQPTGVGPTAEEQKKVGQTQQTVETHQPVQGVANSAPVPDWRKGSFDFLADSTKQLITVATGIVTVTLVFSKDLLIHARFSALIAWILLTVSVLCGICTLFVLSGVLNAAATSNKPPDIAAKDLRFFSGSQIIFFVLGVVAMVIFASIALFNIAPSENKPTTVNCVLPAAPAPIVIHELCSQPPQEGKGCPCKNPPVREK